MASVKQMKMNSSTEEELKGYLYEFLKNEKLIHYITLPFPYCKAGVSECVTLIKQKYFTPGTNKGEFFFQTPLDLKGIRWIIVSLPIEDKNLMKDTAKECGLVIIDAIPTIMAENEWEFFTINKERLFAFENVSDHPIWNADVALLETLLDAENDTVSRILGETEQLAAGSFLN